MNAYLPQLTHLCFTNNDLKPLTELKQLKSLIINKPKIDSLIHYNITDEGVCHIINNCPQIQSIRFERKPQITHKTIYALIPFTEKDFLSFRSLFWSKT